MTEDEAREQTRPMGNVHRLDVELHGRPPELRYGLAESLDVASRWLDPEATAPPSPSQTRAAFAAFIGLHALLDVYFEEVRFE